jgi:hypothetical protein
MISRMTSKPNQHPSRRIRSLRSLILALGFVLIRTMQAGAGAIPIPLTAEVNNDLRQYAFGANYPVAPTTLTVDGVPFNLAPFGNSSLGVVQTADGIGTFTIPVNVQGATTIQTLMNSTFGALGQDIASLTFVGTGANSVTFDLIEGVNIRDHNNGNFNNTIAAGTPSAFFGGGQSRLDMQTFVLPPQFASDTLTEIIFTGTGGSGARGKGNAFLAAVTVSTPEPSSIVLGALAAMSLLAVRFGRQCR